jgi:hypothetical protein
MNPEKVDRETIFDSGSLRALSLKGKAGLRLPKRQLHTTLSVMYNRTTPKAYIGNEEIQVDSFIVTFPLCHCKGLTESESLSLSAFAAFVFFSPLEAEELLLLLLLLLLLSSLSFSSSLSELDELLLLSLLTTGFFLYSSIIPRYASQNFFKFSFIRLSALPCAGLSFLNDALSARDFAT